MAQRTERGVGVSTAAMAPPLSALGQPEEQQAVPAGSGNGPRHRAERPIPPAFVLDAIRQDLDHHRAVPVDPAQQCPGHRNPGRAPAPPTAPGSWGLAIPVRRHLVLQVRIVGDFQGSPAGPLRQVSLRLHLQPPSDLPHQMVLVRGARIFPKHLAVTCAQLLEAQAPQLLNLRIYPFVHDWSAPFPGVDYNSMDTPLASESKSENRSRKPDPVYELAWAGDVDRDGGAALADWRRVLRES